MLVWTKKCQMSSVIIAKHLSCCSVVRYESYCVSNLGCGSSSGVIVIIWLLFKKHCSNSWSQMGYPAVKSVGVFTSNIHLFMRKPTRGENNSYHDFKTIKNVIFEFCWHICLFLGARPLYPVVMASVQAESIVNPNLIPGSPNRLGLSMNSNAITRYFTL